MGQIQYTHIVNDKCCGGSGQVYEIPFGSTIHEIATITGLDIESSIKFQEQLVVEDNVLCPTIYFNTEISENVRKNNCTIGTGSVIEVSVSEGLFSSIISQQDAQKKARDYFNEVAQGIANEQGICIEATCTNCTDYRVSRTKECGEYRYNTECLDGICVDTSQEYFVCNQDSKCLDDQCVTEETFEDCVDCPTYRVSKTTDCGEYRFDQECIKGQCVDTSAKYFVCTGECNGETCIEECIDCSYTCKTGNCPEGYNCTNGQCMPDCTVLGCSPECPDNDTGSECTKCDCGSEKNNCLEYEECENDKCCTPAGYPNYSKNCCESLLEQDGYCTAPLPDFCENIQSNGGASGITDYLYEIPFSGVFAIEFNPLRLPDKLEILKESSFGSNDWSVVATTGKDISPDGPVNINNDGPFDPDTGITVDGTNINNLEFEPVGSDNVLIGVFTRGVDEDSIQNSYQSDWYVGEAVKGTFSRRISQFKSSKSGNDLEITSFLRENDQLVWTFVSGSQSSIERIIVRISGPNGTRWRYNPVCFPGESKENSVYKPRC